MTQASPFKDLKWQFLGPKNVSGRSIDIAVASPRGKNYTIYVATATGGLWKTDNEATTWQPVFEQGPSTTIGDVTMAPSNPDIVWIGTGEANIFRSSQAGAGVYKSTDAGKTWQHMGLAGTYTIPRIVIHPANPDVVYVAASGHEWTNNPERGVYKTADGGKTWDKVLFVDDRTGAIDLVMDPADPDTLYASTWQRIRLKWNDPRNFPDYARQRHLQVDRRRQDVGADQHRAARAEVPGAHRPRRVPVGAERRVRASLTTTRSRASRPRKRRRIPTACPRRASSRAPRSTARTTRAATWTQTSGLTPEQKTFMERHSNTYGWVFGQIRVDPSDANTVYTMGLGLNVSYDGGKTFKRLQTPGGDHHGLWIDPDNSRYLVNVFDQGFAISYDRGATWKDSRLTLPLAQFFNVSYDMDTPVPRVRVDAGSRELPRRRGSQPRPRPDPRRWTSRARRAAKARPTPSTRSTRTSSTRRGSTGR